MKSKFHIMAYITDRYDSSMVIMMLLLAKYKFIYSDLNHALYVRVSGTC